MGHKLPHLSYASVWHGKSRLTQVTQGSVTETYGYSGTGDRVKKVTGSVTTIYLERLWEETLGTGASVKTTYTFGGLPVAVRTSSTGTVTYLHGDHLGSLSVATNSSGGLVNRQEFDPWGKVRSGSLPQTSQNFTGQRLDATGLLYYNARYYDPVIARFISADTIIPGSISLTAWPSDPVASKAWGTSGSGPANPQELNRYSYALNNPTTFNDPTGHWAWIAVAAVIGAGINVSFSVAADLAANQGDWRKVNWRGAAAAAATGAVSGVLVAVGGAALGSIGLTGGLAAKGGAAVVARGAANMLLSTGASVAVDAVAGMVLSVSARDPVETAVKDAIGAAVAAPFGDQVGVPTQGMDTLRDMRATMARPLAPRWSWQFWEQQRYQQRLQLRGGNARAVLINTAVSSVLGNTVSNTVGVIYQRLRHGQPRRE